MSGGSLSRTLKEAHGQGRGGLASDVEEEALRTLMMGPPERGGKELLTNRQPPVDRQTRAPCALGSGPKWMLFEPALRVGAHLGRLVGLLVHELSPDRPG